MKTVHIDFPTGRNFAMTEIYLHPTKEFTDSEPSESEIQNYIDEELNFDSNIQIFQHYVNDDYTVPLYASIDDNIIYDDNIEITPFKGNPKEWDLSNLNELYQSAFKNTKYNEDNIDDECEINDYLYSVIENVYTDIINKNKTEDNVALIHFANMYDIGEYGCDIELEDDEEFDISKLHVYVTDYDGYSYCIQDSVGPFIQYGNKIYELYQEEYEEHYDYYKVADITQMNGYAPYIEYRDDK